MSNYRYGNSSSSQGQMETETIDLCDLCCNNGPIHRIRSIGLCRTCDSSFDYVLNAGVVPFAVELREWQTPCFLRQCYATSATTSSGGASASRAPTRYCTSR